MEKIELKEALETMNQRQVAEHFGVHLVTVKRAIKRFDIEYAKKSGGHYLYRDNLLDPNLKLTKHQQDIITGSLLGDGFLLGTDIFRIKQKKSRIEYVDFLHKELAPFSTPVRIDKSRKPTRLRDGTVSHKLEDWKGGYAWAASFSTRQHQIFADLRNKWYPKGKKILPDDLELNPTILTHWYLQDGSYSKKFGMVRFSCQSFTKNDIIRLISQLGEIGVQSMLSKNQSYNVIDIYDDHLLVLDILTCKPDCFDYKIKKVLA